MWMISIGSLCWSFLFVSVNAFATYLSTPELEWVSNGGHEMGRGNGMVVTPDNELVIYTSSKGVLRSLETKDGKLGTRGYEVIPAVKGVGWTLECTSSVTYHEDSSGQAFVVYAYVNIPPVSSTSEATSFVVVVKHPSNKYSNNVLMTSVEINGKVAGTPVVSSDGKHIYLTHNTQAGGGQFSILDSDTAKVIFTEASIMDGDNKAFYGPIGMVDSPAEGFYNGGEGNTNNMLVWGPLPPDDRTYLLDGSMRGFQLPTNFRHGRANDLKNLKTIRLATVYLTTTTAPTLSKSGREMFLSASMGSIVAWTNGQELDDSKEWSRDDLEREITLRELPIYSPPTLVTSYRNDKILLSSSLSNTYYAFDINSGDTKWELSGLSSIVTSKAIVSSDGYRAFLIEGTRFVRMIDPFMNNAAQMTKWRYNAGNSQFFANGAIDHKDEVLYFGDTSGRISALRVASPPPTISPRPTPTPTPRPTIDPNSLVQTNRPTPEIRVASPSASSPLQTLFAILVPSTVFVLSYLS